MSSRPTGFLHALESAAVCDTEEAYIGLVTPHPFVAQLSRVLPRSMDLVPKAVLGMVALLLGNAFIVGINQIYDVDIDKVKTENGTVNYSA